MALYPQALARLRAACLDYRSHRIGIEQLQAAIWSAAQEIVAVEEKELRRFLQNAEGRLDLLRFTVDQSSLFDRTLELVSEIENYVREWE
jgi:hypothetical protein